MQIRTQFVAVGCAMALLGATPGQARVGVDEDSRPVTVDEEGGGGSGSVAGWEEKEGGFVIRSTDGDYKLIIGGMLQARFEGINWDEDFIEDDTLTFSVRRARLYLVGNFMGKANTFYVQLAGDAPDPYFDYAATAGNTFELLDGWIKHEYNDSLALKFGQFKVPFQRQSLTAPGKLQFPDRSTAAEYWHHLLNRRDVGLEASGAMKQGKVMYAAALVNGDGPDTLNLDDKLAVYGRLSFNPTGDYGYAEGDLEDSDSLASTIGISATYQDGIPEEELEGKVKRVNLDGGLKRHGLSLQGEWTWGEIDPDGGADESVQSFYLQGGWFLRPARAELVLRASMLCFDGDDNDPKEYSAGFNYFWKANRFKWQTAYSYLDDQDFQQINHRITSQLQLWF